MFVRLKYNSNFVHADRLTEAPVWGYERWDCKKIRRDVS